MQDVSVLVLIQSVLGVLRSSFTWEEIAIEHVQYAIDATGFRFKATSPHVHIILHKFAAFDAESGIPNRWRWHFARNNWICFLMFASD